MRSRSASSTSASSSSSSGRTGVGGVRGRTVDGLDDVHPLHNLPKHRVRRGRKVLAPPVEELVVHGVDEELRAAAVGLAGVGLRTQHHVSKEGEGWVRLLPLAELVPG